jgi:hypothetical protein
MGDLATGGLPTGGFPTGGFPTGGCPTGGDLSGDLPVGGHSIGILFQKLCLIEAGQW